MAVTSLLRHAVKPVVDYTRWLHTRWPAGTVEKLPVVSDDGTSNVPGVRVVGDITGIPLLKFSADTGARAVQQIAEEPSFQNRDTSDPDVFDVAIIGGGVSGFSAAVEADKRGLKYVLFEASEPFSTIVNFPKGKPIFTYPTDMTPSGELQFHEKSDVKEGLVEDLEEQTLERGITPRYERVDHVERRGGLIEVHLASGGEPLRARRAVVGIGRSGNFRKLNVPGEDKDKVYNRLHDPADFCGQKILVVGGGDSALESAIALASCGAHVTLSYRREAFSRPKPENVEAIHALASDPRADVGVEEPSSERVSTASGPYIREGKPEGSLKLELGSEVREIRDEEVTLIDKSGQERTLPNDTVFAMIGREAPLDFFRKSGIRVSGEWTTAGWVGLIAFVSFIAWIGHWKSPYRIPFGLQDAFNDSFLAPKPEWWVGPMQAASSYFADPATLGGTLLMSMEQRSFYYTFLYSAAVVFFGIKRIRRRKTPYITAQTSVLAAIQVLPLFILPELILPWMGHNGWWASGLGAWFADTFVPASEWNVHGREYWRAYGFVLAWPLMVWNWFTSEPMWGWLAVGFLQTFVVIPLGIYYWGKGFYCGWICTCGALAETMGDAHRQKMPHGPIWNRVNMVGQAFLLFALVLMLLRIVGWALPDGNAVAGTFDLLLQGRSGNSRFPILNYAYMVDMIWAVVLGTGLYFWFSGRVWCRFACPLAALMHIYARFSRFRIIPEKKKCISCNVCTSVCHQGIDVMNFANKGEPMQDPQCVRCSACVQSCPTGVLSFGQVNPRTGEILGYDPQWLAASPVQMAEVTINGKRQSTFKRRPERIERN